MGCFSGMEISSSPEKISPRAVDPQEARFFSQWLIFDDMEISLSPGSKNPQKLTQSTRDPKAKNLILPRAVGPHEARFFS